MASQNGTVDSGSDTAVFRLDKLPEELRIIIYKNLIPDRLPIRTGLPLSADILDSRKGLHSLCLTSWLTYPAVLPLLYRHIIITEFVQMAGLLVTFIEHDERRAWVYNLAVNVELPKTYYGSNMMRDNLETMSRTISRLYKYEIETPEPNRPENFDEVDDFLPRIEKIIKDEPSSPFDPEVDFIDWSWDGYENGLHDVYERLLELFLEAQTNIKDILLTVPNDRGLSLCNVVTQAQIMTQFGSNPTQPISDNPFQNLRSIRTQAVVSMQVDRWTSFDPDPFGPQHLSSTNWEFLRDNGKWGLINIWLNDQGWPRPDFSIGTGLMIFSHVTRLCLYESSTHPAQLRVILSSCKNLESLTYTTNATAWTDRFVPIAATDDELGVPVPTLQQGLDEVRETLTDLRLGWDPWGAILSEEEMALVAPHQVDVSDLPRLTSSEIDMVFVRGDNHALN